MTTQPGNDVALTGTSGQGFQVQSKADSPNSDAARVIDQVPAAAEKQMATLAARAALAGAQLARLEVDDGEPPFVLTRGPCTSRFHRDAVGDLERAVAALEGRA